MEPAPTTVLNDPFNGLPAALANGTWTLRIRDSGFGDTGSINAASLSINEDCHELTLTFGSVSGTEDFAACDTLNVGPNYVVLAPDGDLTVTSAKEVVLHDFFEVAVGAEFTAAIDTNLSSLLVALEVSRAMAEAARTEEVEAVE